MENIFTIESIFGAINMKTTSNIQRWKRFFYVSAISISFIMISYLAIVYIYPFIIAFFLAFVLQSPICWIKRVLPISQGFASLICIIGVVCIITLLLVISTVESIQAFLYLSKYLPKHIQTFLLFIQQEMDEKLLPIYHKLVQHIHTLDIAHQKTISEQLHFTLQQIAQVSSHLIQNVFSSMIQFIQMIPAFFSICMFTLLGTFFICKQWDNLQAVYQQKLPLIIRIVLSEIGAASKHTFLGYIKAQIILSLCSSTIIYIGLLLFKVDYAFTLAALIGLVDFIPYVGSGMLFIPWIGYLFLIGDYTLTVQLTILYGVVIIQRQFFEPRILAHHIGVNPLLMLIITFILFQILGVFGILLTPFVAMAVQVFQQSHLIQLTWHYIKTGDIK